MIDYEPPYECQVQKENGDWVDPFRIGFGINASVIKTKTESRTVKYKNALPTLAVGKLKTGSLELFIEERLGEPPKLTSQMNKNNS